MSTFIVSAEPCSSHDNGAYEGIPPCLDAINQRSLIPTRGRCAVCLGDGTRVDLAARVEVEPAEPLRVTRWENDTPRKGLRTNVGPTLRRWVESEVDR